MVEIDGAKFLLVLELNVAEPTATIVESHNNALFAESVHIVLMLADSHAVATLELLVADVKQHPDVFEHAKIQRKCVPRVLLEEILKVQQNRLQPDRKRMAQWQKD